MVTRIVLGLGLLSVLSFGVGCDEVPEGGGGAGGGSGGGDPIAEGTLVEVPTGDEPTYVDLDSASVVTASDAWDLRFERKNIFTNGGASGDGDGAAFGPNDLASFGDDTVPADIPFLFEDEDGGAFFRWFAYDGSAHLLYSRYHVYGIRRAGELHKVQVLRFYDEQAGAPVPALYQLRVATITESGVGETEVIDIDGTAGGNTEPTDADPSGCVRLSTRAVTQLTPAEAAASTDWDLCFRRAAISVNGGDNAAGDVEAVDLMADETASEQLAEVMEKTAASELAGFDAPDEAALTASDLVWVRDGIISAFSNRWLKPGKSPLEPGAFSWLVAGSDGIEPFFVAFEGFDGATADSVGTVRMRVKAIGGSLP
jgi:hypothetical protein